MAGSGWDIDRAATALLECEDNRHDRGPITDEWPELDYDTAYAVQDETLRRRLAEKVYAHTAAYDGAIASLDAQLGQLFDELARRGSLDGTIVVVTSDHGEEFAEHGFMSHGNGLHFPALHVPLMVYAPGRAPAGQRVRARCSPHAASSGKRLWNSRSERG